MNPSTYAAFIVGACAALLLLTYATPATENYTAVASRTLSSSLAGRQAYVPRTLQLTPEDVNAVELANGVEVAAVKERTSQAPLMIAASGLLMVVAAAVKLMRSSSSVGQPTYSMLLTSAARAQREKRQQEQEAAKQREIQERLARLSSQGFLPADLPVAASAPKAVAPKAVSAPATASVSARSEKAKDEARKREVEERLARLAQMGFSVPSSSGSVTGKKAPPANLTMHVYDHCPYCIRVELFLGWNGVKYNRVVYGYGDMEGPKALIGKKQLPILTGDGAPYPEGLRGMPESMDMINWLSKDFGLYVHPASGRKDYSDWQKKAKNTIAGLMRPRLLTVPFRDFQTKQDVDYATAKWAKKGFSVEQSWANTPQLLAEMERLLLELEPMIQGDASLNPNGLGMDDIFLLPDLRRLTVVKELKWPAKVRRYVDKALDYPTMQCVPYTTWAL